MHQPGGFGDVGDFRQQADFLFEQLVEQVAVENSPALERRFEVEPLPELRTADLGRRVVLIKL
jgi:hypothetical protein